MSLQSTVARIAELQSLLGGPAAAASPGPSAPAGDFAQMLRSAAVGGPAAAGAGAAGVLAPAALPVGGTVGARIVALAQAEVGQAEMPPGSNDSPRIATYRTATAGSGVGPWCAYFTSWLARQAGAPVGDRGEGTAPSTPSTPGRSAAAARSRPPRASHRGRATSSSGTSTSAWSRRCSPTGASRPSRATPPIASRAACTHQAARSATCAWADAQRSAVAASSAQATASR
jgi:hypothetical protein